MSFLEKIMAGMKDDKGLFQGGIEGRLFGRGKDAIGNLLSGGLKNKARKFAKNFDPSSESHVLKMQKLLNAAGIGDLAGDSLSEDGVFGNKTLSAVRRLQGIPGYTRGSSPTEANESLWQGPIENPNTAGDPEGWHAPMAADYDPNEDEGSTIFGRKGLFKDNKYWPF